MAALPDDPQRPHHWEQGPADVIRLSHRARSMAVTWRWTWRWPWALGDTAGVPRSQARTAINEVLHDPRGWERTGVRFVEARPASKARLIISLTEPEATVCGAGAAGCYSWDGSSLPRAEVVSTLVRDPFSFRLVLNMEVGGHGVFRMHDMYGGPGHNSAHYQGVMGTWDGARATEGWPSETEIADARDWLAGKAPYVHDH